ncbi:MAG: 4-alpha-glucanotransferase [Pirellulaceae bacterium]|nr:4-alpha-glucanotransferase [Pirellulaceae bacterium]
MRLPRASGILLHITSLPNEFGGGDLGPSAFRFIDFLQQAGQRIWQVLPLGPPALGNSPYSCYSAFAGNASLISLQWLVRDGYIESSEMPSPDSLTGSETKFDFDAVAALKKPIFDIAWSRVRSSLCSNEDFIAFCEQNAHWLGDFARFEALSRHFGEMNWSRWPAELVTRTPEALAQWDKQLADEIAFSKFLQFVFDQQWVGVKKYANDHDVQIYGDMPIFVAYESADVWANQSLFCLNEAGEATLVAGVPPDYFSKTGQRWGNPLYRWDELEATDFAWWTDRFEHALRQFDILRVDHFRGFESYWEIPASSPTAMGGKWRKGPQAKPFNAARKKLGELPIVAEDLGMITQEVHDLRDELGFPAMRVAQFGFDDVDDGFHRPDQFPTHSVAYTGTHDNDTLMGWYSQRKPPADGPDPLDDFVTSDDDVHWQLVKAVLDSQSDTAIIPLQDLLGLGNDARMNLPGEATGNWSWRARSSDLTEELADRCRQLTQAANR